MKLIITQKDMLELMEEVHATVVSQIEEGRGVAGQTLGSHPDLAQVPTFMEDVTHEATLIPGLLRWRVEAVPAP